MTVPRKSRRIQNLRDGQCRRASPKGSNSVHLKWGVAGICLCASECGGVRSLPCGISPFASRYYFLSLCYGVLHPATPSGPHPWSCLCQVSSKHGMLPQCLNNVGPALQTVAQRYSDMGSTSRDLRGSSIRNIRANTRQSPSVAAMLIRSRRPCSSIEPLIDGSKYIYFFSFLLSAHWILSIEHVKDKKWHQSARSEISLISLYASHSFLIDLSLKKTVWNLTHKKTPNCLSCILYIRR